MNIKPIGAIFRSVVSNKISYFRCARFVDMVGVTGSIPVAPTILGPAKPTFLFCGRSMPL